MPGLLHPARRHPQIRHGAGKPEGIVACRQTGYNLFDCVIPTREARHNRLHVFDVEEAGAG
ncbi:MAG: hypothetical protein HFJ86_01660 [Oscillospiraceae bacterium]|nr:hypothetical protein [Oscillospiraceae bacterium]